MKKICIGILALTLLISLAGCRSSNADETTGAADTSRPASAPTTEPTTRPTEATTQPTQATTILPTMDATIDTNIPDPDVDTSMPEMDTTEGGLIGRMRPGRGRR